MSAVLSLPERVSDASNDARTLDARLGFARQAVVSRSVQRAGTESTGLMTALQDVKVAAQEKRLSPTVPDATSHTSPVHAEVDSQTEQVGPAEQALQQGAEQGALERASSRASIALDTLAGNAKTAAEVCADWTGDSELRAKIDGNVSRLHQCCAPFVRLPTSQAGQVDQEGQQAEAQANATANLEHSLEQSLGQVATLSGEINTDLKAMQERFVSQFESGQRVVHAPTDAEQVSPDQSSQSQANAFALGNNPEVMRESF